MVVVYLKSLSLPPSHLLLHKSLTSHIFFPNFYLFQIFLIFQIQEGGGDHDLEKGQGHHDDDFEFWDDGDKCVWVEEYDKGGGQGWSKTVRMTYRLKTGQGDDDECDDGVWEPRNPRAEGRKRR